MSCRIILPHFLKNCNNTSWRVPVLMKIFIIGKALLSYCYYLYQQFRRKGRRSCSTTYKTQRACKFRFPVSMMLHLMLSWHVMISPDGCNLHQYLLFFPQVRGLEFSGLSPNHLASGAEEGEICIWDISKPSEPTHFPPLKVRVFQHHQSTFYIN